MGRLLVMIVWTIGVVTVMTQDLETLQLVGMSDTASVGSKYTLICAWEWESSDVTVVKWLSSTTFILFNTTTCAVQKSSDDTSNMVISAGYRHQTLTFVNVTKALDNSYWACVNDIGQSSEQRIIVEEPPIVTLRPLSPTTWYGSTFTLICSNDFKPGKWTSRWYMGQQLHFSLSENSCSPITKGYNFQCTDYQHIVTITNVTSQDDGEMWKCAVVEDVSNTVRLTAYPAPGWPDAVELYTTDTETSITETPTTLTCSTRCEDEKYVFHWNISSGNVSEIEYNSCASRCTQNITFDVDRTHSYYIVKCTVTNKRTGKDGFAVVKLNIESKSKQDANTTVDMTGYSNSDSVVTTVTAVSGTLGIILFMTLIIIMMYCKVKKQQDNKSDKGIKHRVCLDTRHEDDVEIRDGDNGLDNNGYITARPDDHVETGDNGNRHTDGEETQGDHGRGLAQSGLHTSNTYSVTFRSWNQDDTHEYRELHVYAIVPN